MESKKRILGLVKLAPALALLWTLAMVMKIHAQDTSSKRDQNETRGLTLQKTAQSRQYQGREVEGEEKHVGPGDTLWRILVREKGLPEKRFSQYLVIIRGLNPQIKKIDVLRVGDSIFIPLRPDDLLGASSANADEQRMPIARGDTKEYRVKQGEHLYQILREQLDISNDRDVAQYYALVKDLNPERRNWDALLNGDVIRLPLLGKSSDLTSAQPKGPAAIAAQQKREEPKETGSPPYLDAAKRDKSPAPANLTLDYARQLRAKENVALLGRVMETLGNEFRRDGQETLTLREGTVRIDRDSYPVVYNPKLQQTIILDPEEKIPGSLRSKLTDTAVVPIARTSSLQESVNQLLSRLGYQSLPTDRPVVMQEAGVSIEARGNWMALAPQESNKAQDIFIIALTDKPQDIPDYLRQELSNRGLHLKDILLATSDRLPSTDGLGEPAPSVKHWPREKSEFVDAMLLAFSVPFGVSERLSIEMGQGLRVDIRCDRIFERNSRRTGLFFHRLEPEIKKVLQEKKEMKIVELDLLALNHKEIMARLLSELGEPEAYREHRLSASASKDRLTITAWGFLLAKRGMFVTDREIPEPLHRFFFEKGLEIVYF